MKIRLIVDSCCDTTPELHELVQPLTAPLSVEVVGEAVYVDDRTVDIPALLEHMRAAPNGMRSACPSPEAYASLMRQCEACFVITLSSRLSGSYNAACVGRDMVLEEFPDKKIMVLDSESASAGEVQIMLYVHERIEEGLSFEQIVPLAQEYIRKLRTLFVLEDLGNLFRNGRLQKIAGAVASKIKLCPIMSDDGQGNIKLVSPSLGMRHALHKLVDLVVQHTQSLKNRSVRLVLCFCNCKERAEKLKESFLRKCPAIREIILVPVGALSAMYANDGGVIIAL